MSLVEREEVPEEKSSLSTRPTRSPLVTASRATPEPVAPPPITRTSRGLVAPAPISADRWTSLDGTAANGSWIFSRTAARCDPPSLTDTGGERRMEPPYAVATAAPTAVPSRLRRVMERNERRKVRRKRDRSVLHSRSRGEWRCLNVTFTT